MTQLQLQNLQDSPSVFLWLWLLSFSILWLQQLLKICISPSFLLTFMYMCVCVLVTTWWRFRSLTKSTEVSDFRKPDCNPLFPLDMVCLQPSVWMGFHSSQWDVSTGCSYIHGRAGSSRKIHIVSLLDGRKEHNLPQSITCGIGSQVQREYKTSGKLSN